MKGPKIVWHWWENGKRISRHRALSPGMFDFRILDVREDHKGRLLYDAEMLR